MMMKGARLLPLSLLFLVLTAPCPAQSTRVALIDTNAFTDPKNGITRLVNALSLVEKEFEKRHAKMRELQSLLLRQPSGPGFVGPIPTDPRPMTRERRQQLKEDAKDAEKCLFAFFANKPWRALRLNLSYVSQMTLDQAVRN